MLNFLANYSGKRKPYILLLVLPGCCDNVKRPETSQRLKQFDGRRASPSLPPLSLLSATRPISIPLLAYASHALLLILRALSQTCAVSYTRSPNTHCQMQEFVNVVTDMCEGPGSKGLGAVVLTGAGRAFSAGGDLEFLKAR